MKNNSGLARSLRLGSAKEGTHNWWWQRLTAIALIPLSLWFVGSIWSIIVDGANYDALQSWLAGPIAAILMLTFIFALFFHLKLGLQVIIEDYVHNKTAKWSFLITLNLSCIIGGIISIYSTIAIALGG